MGLSVVRLVGAIGLVVARTTLALPHLDGRELRRSLVLFGYRSLPLALVAAMLIGSTVVLQAGVYAVKYGARLYTGWAAGYALMREFGPLLLGLVMSARIGARNASELALLTVNGQMEGLRGISLDPFALLVAPRILGSALAIAALSMVTFFVAVVFEAVASFYSLHLPLRVFFTSFSEMLRTSDFLGGIVKTVAFGGAISLVSTVVGLKASGGAVGVGRAAAEAVVFGCASIFLLDLLLTPFLTRVFS
jgi:phospholipid/cholesterol/gamma-HCH transport system permease protein